MGNAETSAPQSPNGKDPDFVYRLVTVGELTLSRTKGALPLRSVDEKDGYIHLSCRDQLCETANLHFTDETKMFAVAFRPQMLEPRFGWHAAPKRGCDFPHTFAPLTFNAHDHILVLKTEAEGFVIGESHK